MSLLSKYFFDPLKAMIIRASTSSAPALASAGKDALATLEQAGGALATSALAGTLSVNSAMGVASKTIGALEDDLRAAVDAYAMATVGALPIVGGVAAPEAVKLANETLAWAEDHTHTYVATLFNHVFGVVNAPAPQPTAPGGGSIAQGGGVVK